MGGCYLTYAKEGASNSICVKICTQRRKKRGVAWNIRAAPDVVVRFNSRAKQRSQSSAAKVHEVQLVCCELQTSLKELFGDDLVATEKPTCLSYPATSTCGVATAQKTLAPGDREGAVTGRDSKSNMSIFVFDPPICPRNPPRPLT